MMIKSIFLVFFSITTGLVLLKVLPFSLQTPSTHFNVSQQGANNLWHFCSFFMQKVLADKTLLMMN